MSPPAALQNSHPMADGPFYFHGGSNNRTVVQNSIEQHGWLASVDLGVTKGGHLIAVPACRMTPTAQAPHRFGGCAGRP